MRKKQMRFLDFIRWKAELKLFLKGGAFIIEKTADGILTAKVMERDFNKTEAPFKQAEESVKQHVITISYVAYYDRLFRVIRSSDGRIIDKVIMFRVIRSSDGRIISPDLQEACKQYGFTVSYVAYYDRLFGVIRSSDGRIIDEVVMCDKISRFFHPAESDLQDSCVPRLKE